MQLFLKITVHFRLVSGYPPQNWLPMVLTAVIISMVSLVVGCGNCSNVAVNMVVLAGIVVLVAFVGIVLCRLIIEEVVWIF